MTPLDNEAVVEIRRIGRWGWVDDEGRLISVRVTDIVGDDYIVVDTHTSQQTSAHPSSMRWPRGVDRGSIRRRADGSVPAWPG
jgi:hypothetical protein